MHGAARDDQPSWRLSPFLRVAYVVVVSGFVALGIGETVVAGWKGLAVLGFAPVAVWLCWRQGLNPRITLTPDTVVIQNPYSRKEVSLADIAAVDVEPGSTSPLIIRLRAGGSIVPWCVQGSALFGHRTQERAEAIAHAIRARMRT